jgi:hypothetical protein
VLPLRPADGPGAEIETGDGHPARCETLRQFTGASAEFQDGLPGPEQGWQRSLEPTMIAHDTVDYAQVPAAVNGVRMVGWKRVEQLGVKHAR